MASVLMLLRTSGLQYDDRVRKQAAVLSSLGYRVNITALEALNKRREGTIGESRFETLRFFTVRVFSPGNGLPLKAIEYVVRWFLVTVRRRPQTLWLHTHEATYFLPVAFVLRRLGVIRRIVWEQRELPPSRWLSSRLLGRLMSFLMRQVDCVIVASPWRRDLLAERLSLPPESMAVVENLADRVFTDLPQTALPENLSAWLNGSRFFVVQNGAVWRRNFRSLVAAMNLMPEARLVVIGGSEAEEIAELRRMYPWFDERIYLLGMVPQLELTRYLDHAVASIVLYQNCSDNNWLCAPNRLYQAAARGTPLLVGANPPSASFVSKLGSGLVLADDGSDPEELSRKMLQMLEREAEFREIAREKRYDTLWESQIPEFVRIMKGPSAISDGPDNVISRGS